MEKEQNENGIHDSDNHYTEFERLLGLPAGSTIEAERKIHPIVAKNLKAKTNELEKTNQQLDVLSNMPNADLVKSGFTLETLKQDKIKIRNETFAVYNIAKDLLDSYKAQIDNLLNPNDKMWMAGAKLIDSVTNSLDKLLNMTLKFKQDAEMEGLNLVNDNNNKSSKEMTPKDWFLFIKAAKEAPDDKFSNIIDNKSPSENTIKDNKSIIDSDKK